MRDKPARTSVAAVEELLRRRVRTLPAEKIGLHQAAGRILATDIMAEVDVPGFARAAMDGFAVRSQDTLANAAETILTIVGESLPSRPYYGAVQSGQAVRIMTGAPVPDGADAVVPVEITDEANGRVQIQSSIASGRHVSPRGEDIHRGETILRARRRLRPQDVGVLAALGVSPIAIIRQPTVAILITGDELLPCGERPVGYQIVDSNSVMLEALVRRDGGLVQETSLLADQPDIIADAMRHSSADLIVVSGGTSVGREDHAARVLATVGELCVHGIALRPGGPTGIGFLEHRPVFLLPGNPVACLCGYDLFAGAALRLLGGRCMEMPYRRATLPLAEAIPSVLGRCDYVRVALTGGEVHVLAVSGASRLSSATRADGFLLIPSDCEGLGQGSPVTVHFYDA